MHSSGEHRPEHLCITCGRRVQTATSCTLYLTASYCQQLASHSVERCCTLYVYIIQCTDRRQQSVATEDAGDTERRSSFHHWSQEVRAHDASVTRPSLATSTAKDQVQDGCTGIQVSPWHGSTIPDIILHTGLCSNWTFQLVIRDNKPTRARTRTVYGSRSFAVHGPVVWNSLPAELRLPDMTRGVFRKQLKTHLFNCQ